MDRLSFKKPREHFDVGAQPSHVTFDDGKVRHNLPWIHYVEARWDRGEPDTIMVLIGEWIVALKGYNMGPLFAAIEEQALLRVCAYPAKAIEHDDESFVMELRILKSGHGPVGKAAKKNSAPQMDLNIDRSPAM